MTDTRPTVPPIEGLNCLRDGQVLRLQGPWPAAELQTEFDGEFRYHWTDNGQCYYGVVSNFYPDLDIIATISPELMAAVADGRVQALLDAAQYVQSDRGALWSGNDSDEVSLDMAMTELSDAYNAITAIQGDKP